MTRTLTVADITRVLTQRIEFARDRCARFAVKFADDPAYALEWAGDVFLHAAELHVSRKAMEFMTYEAVGRLVEDDERIEELRVCARQTVINEGCDVPNSTSPTHVLMRQHITAQWVRLDGYLSGDRSF